MISNIYAVHDNKAVAFMAPFTTANAGTATRTFKEHVNNPETVFARHPNDFCLYEIGTFDDSTGEIFNYKENINLGLAVTYVEPLTEHTKLEAIK